MNPGPWSPDPEPSTTHPELRTKKTTNQQPNLFAIFASRLNDQKLRYMITGSVASIIYGDPRLMHDIDIVLDLDPSRVHNFVAAFPAEEYYVAPIEIIKDELLRTERGHFKLIHLESGFKADIYLKGKSDLHEWALERSKKVRIKGIALSVAPPEYVILRKLEYFREGHSDRHLNDIKTIVKNSAKLLDTPFIENYCSDHGLSDLWKSVWRPGKVKVKESKRKEKRKKK